MKNFVPLNNLNIAFGDCKNCKAHCCSGEFGTVYSQILKEEFEFVYKNFPILFIFGDLGFIKPVILISDGFNFCPYLIDFKCTIYNSRPNVCKTYPLSPNIDNKIYIDNSCPEISKGKNSLDFKNEVFDNYQNKYLDTHFEFEKLNRDDFIKITSIKGVEFFKYIGTINSKYLNLHKESLANLKRVELSTLS